MAVVEYGGWSMPVSREVAEDPAEVEKVLEVLRMIIEVERGNRNE